jgi:transcriptional regulator with XRE-family HTH domain
MLTYNRVAIRTLRLAREIDTDTLGRRARLTGRAIRAIERGSIPRADTLGRIASVLGVGVETFYVQRTTKRAGVTA